MVIAFAGNKVDLVKDRKVDSEEAAEYARSQGEREGWGWRSGA